MHPAILQAIRFPYLSTLSPWVSAAWSASMRAQLYFGDNLNNLPVVGIPVDLVLCGDASRCGESGVRSCAWEPDSGDDDYDAEIDKRMRNNGFMKGELGLWNGTTGCRSDGYKHIIRHLVTP